MNFVDLSLGVPPRDLILYQQSLINWQFQFPSSRFYCLTNYSEIKFIDYLFLSSVKLTRPLANVHSRNHWNHLSSYPIVKVESHFIQHFLPASQYFLKLGETQYYYSIHLSMSFNFPFNFRQKFNYIIIY
jgi:hypothetical protein